MEQSQSNDYDRCNLQDVSLFARATQLHKSGQLAPAQSICMEILSRSPEQPDALHLLGIMAHQQGHSDMAKTLLQKASEANPQDLNILKNLILVLKERGQMAVAVSYCQKALLIDSDNSRIYQGLGHLFIEKGYPEEAVACYEKVLSINPQMGLVWGYLGNARQCINQYDEAISCYRKALVLDPANAELYYNMGVAFSEKGMLDKAVSNFEKTLVLDPDHSQAMFNMGKAVKAQGRLEEAITCYQKCIHLNAGDIDAHHNLANAFYAEGHLKEAMDAYTRVLQLNPDHTLALNNLAGLLKDIGAEDQAHAMLKRSIEIDPNDSRAYLNLGNLLKERNESEMALEAYQKAIFLAPDNSDALMNLGRLLKKEGAYDEGMKYLKAAVELSPDISNVWWYYYLSLPILYNSESEIAVHRKRLSQGMDELIRKAHLDTPRQCKKAMEGIGSFTNFYLQYQGLNDVHLQKKYGDFVHRAMATNFPQWAVPLSMPRLKTNGKIRIGILSSFMRSHTVGYFLRGWLDSHDRDQFEVHGYYIGGESDDLTKVFKEKFDHFHHIPGNIESMAQQIRNDDLHILTYTDIGMFGPATQLAGLRLAPVQCNWWGHPITTGLTTIDYYLSSDLMEPPGAASHYSETLVLLPNLSMAFKTPELPENEKTRAQFGLSDFDIVFLSSQSLFKYLPQYDDIYPRIAEKVKNARFVFISNPNKVITEQFRKRLEIAFHRRELSMERCCVFQPRLSPEDFKGLHQVSDIMLDTISWSGGKTTLEALACGLPVVTCPGPFMRGRHAYAMLERMEITETIAFDVDSYIDIAVRLGMDRSFHDHIRSAIKSKRHLLYNDSISIQGLEAFYRHVVKVQHCAQENDFEDETGEEQTAEPDLKKSTGLPSTTDMNQELQRAVAFHRAGDIQNAQAGYRNVLKFDPKHPDALHLMGCIASKNGDYDKAIRLIRQAIEQFPNSDIYYTNLGNALVRLHRVSEAVDAYETALKLNPSSVDALNNLATNLGRVDRTRESLSFFQKALQIDPNAVEVYNNLGNALTELGQIDEAVNCFRKAIALKPDYAAAHNNLGSSLRCREQLQQAVESYCRAIEVKPEYAEAINNLGETLAEMGKPDEAVSFFRKAIDLKGDFELAISNLLYASIRVCDWGTSLSFNSVLDGFTEGALQQNRCPVEDPFLNLVRHDSPKLNYKVATAWSEMAVQRVGASNHDYNFQDRRKGNRKLIIGYLSNNFHDHPMAHLILRLLAVHNRETVEVRCFSSGRDDGSAYRGRIVQASDKFVDIRRMSHREAADCIYANKVDILVDLMGHTKGNRLAICASKPAPIQVRYLGMAGTTGATFFDYLIADAVVVPNAHFPFYSEKIVHLPHSYQVNDNRQEASSDCFRRKDEGLPEDGFVFCSFNQPYKIDPVIYGAWMKILRSVPQSVLWLQGGNALAERNLIQHAEAMGVDGDRIIFAQRVTKAEHLARLRLADVGLDTRLVSGAATTSDALWAGVPVITLKGGHFSSRMSASILSAVGLGELAVADLDEYCATVTLIAQSPEVLLSKKNFLKEHLSTSKLFDTRGITKQIETAYSCMWQRYCAGGEPEPIVIKDLTDH